MIFVTVGGQKPFQRLVDTVDDWAGRRGLDRDEVLAQIGQTQSRPTHIASAATLDPPSYREVFERSTVVVSHAGMGTILTAIELEKPLLVMPRRAASGEHRNDHQLATARQLEELIGLEVAWDERALSERLDALESVRAPTRSEESRRRLIGFVASLIDPA